MNIKIVICFIIIYFLPLASASTADWVWTAKSSGFLKTNDSLTYENYLIKVKTVDSNKATLMVYKDMVLKEIKDFKVNEFKNYDNIGVKLLGINGNYSWISFSVLESRFLWAPTGKATLKWGDSYTIGNYSINIEALRTDSVNLTISSGNAANTFVFQKDGFKDFENLRIAVRDINRTGFIELEFLTYRAPVIKAEIITDKDEYSPDETIQITTNLTSGDTLDVAGIFLNGKNVKLQPDMFTAVNFTGNGSFISRIDRLPVNSTIIITAKIETRDYYNNSYVTEVGKEIFITPVVSLVKHIPADTDEENVPVRLYVYNSGTDNKSITVHDTIPDGFTALQEPNWTIELEPGKSANLTYYIIPPKPGIYDLPPAVAKWGTQSSVSRKTKMAVHMPYISMSKTAVYNNSLTDVQLIITNTGDRAAIVRVSDNLPEESILAGGETKYSGFMEKGDTASIRYSLQGNIEALPAADATYRDILGAVRRTQSNTIETNITVAEPGETDMTDTSLSNAGRNEIITFMITSFLVIAGIIGSVAFMAYLVTSLKLRSR